MKKTYSIYVRMYGEDNDPISEFSRLTGFSNCLKGFAQGAMAMAESFYSARHEFICRCDQTDDVLDHVYPRKLHVN